MLQQQKFYLPFRHIVQINKKNNIYNSRNFICHLDFNDKNFDFSIYNSRNFICHLDCCNRWRCLRKSTIVEILFVIQTNEPIRLVVGCIYNSRNFICHLDFAAEKLREVFIYNSRNFICHLDFTSRQVNHHVSTIVEILFVIQTIPTTALMNNIYNSRNFICHLDLLGSGIDQYISTIVEILFVIQT